MTEDGILTCPNETENHDAFFVLVLVLVLVLENQAGMHDQASIEDEYEHEDDLDKTTSI